MRLLYTMIVVSLCLSAGFFSAEANAAPDNPRLANYFLNWTLTDSQAVELARWDLLVLDIENQYRNPHLIKKIRRLNPDVTILAYITPQEIRTDAHNGFSVARRELAGSIPDAWYLKDDTGSRLSWWSGTYLLNVTNKAPKVNGKRFNEFLVDFMVDDIMSSGLWNGIYYDNAWDNISFFTGTNVDINGDGSRDASADKEWQEGMRFIYNETKQRIPHAIIVGNGTTRAYRDELQGMMLENFIAPAWESTMNTFAYNSEGSNRVNIINTNTGNSGGQHNYRHMRFGLGSTLLEDGYYSYDFGDTNHGQTWWYDEYNVDLGAALSDAVSEQGHDTYIPDVWRRDFSHGLSLVNSTNEAQTVELGGEFEKIHGTQDVSVNDGSIVSEVDLDAADGLILLKTFDTLDDIVFENGAFARFFRADGSRVRNGFFIFEDEYEGGDSIAHVDLDGNGKRDLLVVRGNKITAWRDDGLLFLKVWPYSANYTGGLRVSVGDIYRNGQKQIFVSPTPGYPAPIKVYTIHGRKIQDAWYPFGQEHAGGYALAVADLGDDFGRHVVVGAGEGMHSIVELYNYAFDFERRWQAFEKGFLGGVSVAGGNVIGDGFDEIIVGAGPGKDPVIRVFARDGSLVNEFTAYSSFSKPGIRVGTVDVDFDGILDIVGFSEGPGL